MKNQFTLTIILISFFLSVNAQVKVYDSNNNPVSNVKIFSKDGRLIALSDWKGEIDISNLEFPKKDSIEIYHSKYISKKMVWNDINEKIEIYLKPDSIHKLEEVIITAKKLEYLSLKGYFFSYQIMDNVVLTFSDGIVEYYINLTKEKVIDTRIIESRTFKNNDSIKAFWKRKDHPAVNVISMRPLPPFDFNEEVLLSDWNNYKVEQDGNIKSKNKVIGRITNYNDDSELRIEYFSPENTKKISILGLTSEIKNKTIVEKFNSPTPKIEKIANLDLYYNSEITKKDISVNYELIQGFYIIKKKSLSKDNFKTILNEKEEGEQLSNYLENKTISVIPKFIELMLYKNLELIPNEK